MPSDVIVLIGMPGAGKTHCGKELAAALKKKFVDTDDLIEARCGQSLQTVVDKFGYQYLRELEEQVLLSSEFAASVVATGGSAIYSERGMARLMSLGTIVYLSCAIDVLAQRIENFPTRGLAKKPSQTLASLYRERLPHYQRYAELTVDSSHSSPTIVVERIIEQLAAVETIPDPTANRPSLKDPER